MRLQRCAGLRSTRDGAMCGKVLKECCDLYYEVEEMETGARAYVCGDCAAKVEAEEEEEK